MKFFSAVTVALAALAELALTAPVAVSDAERRGLSKRAAVTDSPTTGYATLSGGTTGGRGGSTVTVTTLDQLNSAATDDTPRIVVITGTISGSAQVRVGSNKTIIGKNSSAKLVGIGLYVNGKKNVIIRNLTIQKVLADNGDAIGLQKSTNIWVDHCDLSSDLSHDKDYYDGLLDITHAVDRVTVSYNKLSNHWKGSLVGHSDSNGSEDKGHLTVTYHNNYFSNLNSRGPSFRFGTGHIYNNFYENVADGINTRQGAQLLVQSNVFVNSKKPLYSTDAGYAVDQNNDFGGASNTALKGSLTSVPYSYSLISTSSVRSAVVAGAGAKLSF